MSLNENLRQAKQKKNDEFYTQLSDIENELQHYEAHFAGKTIYCNCDDPRVSNFYRYFSLKFEDLKIKRLIASCYRNQDADLFSRHDSKKAVWIEYTGYRKGERTPRDEDAEVHPFEGDGDFRSAECIELLKQADIVVTNPPFSLFREYVAQLIEHGKKFLIVGNKNAITYKEVFPLVKESRMWVGHTPMSKDLLFDLPEDIARELKATKKEGSSYKIVNGIVKGRSQSIWFTNLYHKKRHKLLKLGAKYKGNEEEYPTYDNYDAINVSRVADIPRDWTGVMGVPISFLDKHNPEQFEILGVSYLWDDHITSHTFYNDFKEMRPDGTKTGSSGTKANGMAVLRGKAPQKNYFVKGDVTVYKLYDRIFVKRTRPS